MATGASTANLAIILIDARYGVLPQSRRHAYHRLAAGHSAPGGGGQQDGPGGFPRGRLQRASATSSRAFAAQLRCCATCSSSPSARWTATTWSTAASRTPWYHGPSLLEHLETVPIARDRNLTDMRFPGAVRDPAQSGFPRLRRPGGLRRDPPRRPGHGAALRPHQPREIHRHLGWRSGRGVRAHVGHGLPGRRNRHQPRRHAGASPATCRTRPGASKPWWCG